DRVMRLYDVYRQRLTLDITEVRFEDIVKRPRKAARALFSAVGMKWEPAIGEACHRIGRNAPGGNYSPGPQPIHIKNHAGWRQYAHHMPEALAILKHQVQKRGYTAE